MSGSSIVSELVGKTAGEIVGEKKRVINLIITHSHPHEDEIIAIAMLSTFWAWSKFNISSARIVTLKSDAELDSYRDRKDVLFIGIGAKFAAYCADQIFDEHAKGLDMLKKKEVCAADLVIKALDAEMQPKAVKLLEEVRRHDLTRHSEKTCLATCLKALYEQEDEKKVIQWGLAGAEALCRHLLSGETLIKDKDLFLSIASNAYVLVGKANKLSPTAFKALLTQLQGSADSNRLTEISTIFFVLNKEAKAYSLDWLKIIVMNLARMQVQFLNGLEDYNRYHKEIIIKVGHPDRRLKPFDVRVAFMQSDSGIMNNIFRSKEAGGCELLVLRNSRGQVSIFTDDSPRNGQVGKFNLKPLIQMIRWAEISKAGKKHPRWEMLDIDGEHFSAPEWFFFQQGRMILNGSKSKPDVKPTKLDYEDFVYILERFGTDAGIEDFIQSNKVY